MTLYHRQTALLALVNRWTIYERYFCDRQIRPCSCGDQNLVPVGVYIRGYEPAISFGFFFTKFAEVDVGTATLVRWQGSREGDGSWVRLVDWTRALWVLGSSSVTVTALADVRCGSANSQALTMSGAQHIRHGLPIPVLWETSAAHGRRQITCPLVLFWLRVEIL